MKKKAMSFENKIIKTENEKQISKNRRVRQFLAFFYLKYNLLIQGDENNINVDKYYFDDLTLSDESKAFELAKIIYNLRNNAITFIEANNDFMLNKTPKQKMNYVAGLYGKEKLDSYVKFLLNSAVKELVSNKKTTQNNTQEDELNF